MATYKIDIYNKTNLQDYEVNLMGENLENIEKQILKRDTFTLNSK